jgi:hypothetical protein
MKLSRFHGHLIFSFWRVEGVHAEAADLYPRVPRSDCFPGALMCRVLQVSRTGF